jgi:hypothetical protein
MAKSTKENKIFLTGNFDSDSALDCGAKTNALFCRVVFGQVLVCFSKEPGIGVGTA